ncbi:1,4-dihydroxy-6-naphthoate synthase [Desulfovibrio sp. OttesenSCG-928-O18]|nr:1,4-dihydroxy-6-naphthoate synthase [Desulfovibrio sp. OttesenSCG-928-O18]
MALQLGISPCPNDTYIFSALIAGRVSLPDVLGPLETHFADVEELNFLARQGRLDVTKLSASAVADVLDEYVVLHSGGALGRGCGPLLVATRPLAPRDLHDASIVVPGLLTTANLLLSLHGGFTGPRHELIFDQVMPALARGEYDAGVIIHESRFTYADHGFSCVLDLGKWWEDVTGAPIPLGVIAAKRSLGEETLRRIGSAIRLSLEDANTNPERHMPFIRSHAQEMDDTVLAKHIAMFVNEFSLDLGPSGRDAVRQLVTRAAYLRGVTLPQDKPLFAPV